MLLSDVGDTLADDMFDELIAPRLVEREQMRMKVKIGVLKRVFVRMFNFELAMRNTARNMFPAAVADILSLCTARLDLPSL